MQPTAFRTSPRQRFRLISKVVGWSMGIGAIIGVTRGSGEAFVVDALLGALIAAIIASGTSAFELLVVSNPNNRLVRQLPPAIVMLLRAAVFGGVILIGLAVPGLILGTPLLWNDPAFAGVFAVSVAVAIGVSTGVELVRFLGSEATRAMITGRYSRPRIEHRVILFADLIGSTALAERIGDLRFHSVLQAVAQDVSVAIDGTRGEVHRYVGDAIIVTWPQTRGVDGGACLSCAARMHAALASRAAWYEKHFEAAPRLRISIHAGPIAAGQIGAWKKEIALLGDTMNTTARLEGAARTHGAQTVVSSALVQALPPDVAQTLTRLPDFTAAGKERALEVWSAAH